MLIFYSQCTDILYSFCIHFVFIMYSFDFQVFIQGNAINVWLLAGVYRALLIIRKCTAIQVNHMLNMCFYVMGYCLTMFKI
jgi:hypothetical protein